MQNVQSILLLIASLLLLASGGYLTYTDQVMWVASACMRAGAVLLAVWIALPQLRNFRWTANSWVIAGGIVCAVVLAIRPKAMLFVGPILLALGALQFVRWLFAPMPPKNSKPKRQG